MNQSYTRRDHAAEILQRHHPDLTDEQRRPLLPIVLACLSAIQEGVPPHHLLRAAAAVYDTLRSEK